MTFFRLLTLSRPRFWLYELGTFGLGVVCALGAGVMVPWWLVLLFALYFLFPANLLIYGINDVYDYETDIRNPKKTGYEDVLPKALHRRVLQLVALTSVGFVMVAIFLPLPALLAFLAFIFFAVGYSMPPVRAKARPFFDSVFSAGHYVATGVFGFYLAGGEGSVVLPVVAGMLWAMAMHAYSAVPDIAADSEAGLRTIATLFGAKITIVLCLGMYVAAGIIAYWYLGVLAFTLTLPYVAMMGASYNANDLLLMRLYKYFPTINTFVGMAISFLVFADKGWL